MKEKEVKKMLNKIFTDKEYMAQGFTAEEVPMIREHDMLFNEDKLYGLTEVGKERLFFLAEKLGL